MPRPRKPSSPFRYFNSSPEIIRLAVMMYGRFPLSLRAVEDLLFEWGIDICHETVRFWWNRFGSMFASEIRRERVSRMRGIRHWRRHLDEVFVKINGEQHCRSDQCWIVAMNMSLEAPEVALSLLEEHGRQR